MKTQPHQPVSSGRAALASIGTEFLALAGSLSDPLGISIGDVSDLQAVAEEQEVQSSTLTNIARLFGSLRRFLLSGICALCALRGSAGSGS